MCRSKPPSSWQRPCRSNRCDVEHLQILKVPRTNSNSRQNKNPKKFRSPTSNFQILNVSRTNSNSQQNENPKKFRSPTSNFQILKVSRTNSNSQQNENPKKFRSPTSNFQILNVSRTNIATKPTQGDHHGAHLGSATGSNGTQLRSHRGDALVLVDWSSRALMEQATVGL